MTTFRRGRSATWASVSTGRWLLCVLAVFPRPATADEALLDSFQAAEHRDAHGQALRYRLFVPSSLEPGRTYPLVLYLHGLKAVGSDNRRQVIGSHELGARVWAAPEFQSAHPCFVLAPQCPFGSIWANPFTRRPSKKLRAVEDLVAELTRRLPVDTDRLYVTGQSMGGFGTWAMIAAYPGMFAAAVPVCGGGSTRRSALLSKTPVWAFHGSLDPVVLPRESRRMIDAIRKAGGTPRYTEFPMTLHNSWEPAYSDPELWLWMFAQKRLPQPGEEK
jgi:predicted peptidase